ncbi:monocarboxylate transporter 9-like [Tubulanus polymorphus]|uniref:monocarboxylate transporter 9-like n=1 Tax=Tubulanus polymorphus TaxID=672921 RepID=UPI003DA55022
MSIKTRRGNSRRGVGPLEAVVITCCGMLDYLLIQSLFNTAGILVPEWMQYFNAGSATVAWVGASITGSTFLFSPFGSLLVKQFGLRPMLVSSGVLCSLSIVLSALATRLYIVIICWTVSGFCIAVHIAPVASYVLTRFGRHRALANGIVALGAATGSLIYPIIINQLLEHYDWRGCLVIIGGIALNLAPLTMVNRNWSTRGRSRAIVAAEDGVLLEALKTNEINPERDAKTRKEKEIRMEYSRWVIFKESLQLTLFKKPFMITMLLHTSVSYMAVSIIVIHMVAGFKELMNLESDEARMTVTAFGVGNIIGRVLISLLAHHKSIDTFTVYIFGNLFVGLIALAPVCRGFVAAMCLSGFVGFSLASFGCLLQVVLVEVFGERLVLMAYSYAILTGGFGYIAGGPIAGSIYDHWLDYSYSFYLSSALAVGGTLIIFPNWFNHLRRLYKGQNSSGELSPETKDWIASQITLT